MSERIITLITGGSRSGKSALAREKALSYPRRIYLATAEVTDPEMARRIARHQKERGPEFRTVEEPLHLARSIRRNAPEADVILVDCLTFWLNNLFHHFRDEAVSERRRIESEISDFLKVLDEKPTHLVLVTNEINMGVIPGDPISRRFVDEQGWLNQEVARRADEVIFMVAGLPQALKGSESFLRK